MLRKFTTFIKNFKTFGHKNPLMRRNILILLATSFFAFPAFWSINIANYILEAKGISNKLFFTLFGLYAFFVFFLEIPTGVIADKVSRKLSVLLGYLFSASGFLLLILLPSIYSVLLLFLVLGVGVSLISGAVESILYDTLAELDSSKNYKRINSFIGFFALVTASGYIYISGHLIDLYGESSTMYATVISYTLAFILTLFLTEPAISSKARKLNNDGYLKHTIKSIKLAFGSKAAKNGMLLLMGIYSFVYSIMTGLKYVIPIIIGDYGGTKVEISSLSSISLFAIGISAVVFIGIWKGAIAFKLIMASALLFLAPLIWSLNGSLNIAWIIVLVISLSPPIVMTILDQKMNDELETHMRASILSLRNMVARGVAGVLFPIFGWAREFWGIQYAVGIITIWMFIAFVGLLFYWKTKGLDKFQ